MINHFNAAVVPDTTLKRLPTVRCLLIARVLQTQWRLIPAIESDWLGLLTPRCMLQVRFRQVPHRQAWILGRPTRQNTVIVRALIVVLIVQRSHIVHSRVEQVVKVLGWLVAQEIGQVELMVDGERVEQASEKSINAIPRAELLSATIWHLASGAEELEILNDVTVEAQSHPRHLLGLSLVLFAFEESLFFLPARNRKVIRALERLEQYIPLLVDTGREFWHGVIVRCACKVIIRQSLDVLKMRLVLAFVEASALVVEVHEQAELVAHFIHDVLVRLLGLVHQDRFYW